MKEEWRPIVVDGKVHPWYSISNFGNVRSHIQSISLGRKGFDKSYNPNFYKDRSPYLKKHGNGSLSKMEVNLQFPKDFFEDYQYAKSSKSFSTVSRKCSAHELVMAAFRPMDEYPPDRLKDCWKDIPEEAKQWIRESAYVDHIDGDTSNNHIDNLRWCTPKQNSKQRKNYAKVN